MVQQLMAMVQSKNMPHLMLCGTAGIGKTSSIHALARDLLGDHYKNAVLELNASDERGIDVVRNQIKQFAQRKVTLPAGLFKIIVLDEVDSMTVGSQQALRRIMEMFSGTTRFALACNISAKVIEPIQSRCAIMRYNRISDEEMSQCIHRVSKKEGIQVTDDCVHAVVYTAEGDVRRALNVLQSLSTFDEVLTAETVYKIADVPHPETIEQALTMAINGDVNSAIAPIYHLYEQGYAPQDISLTILRVIKVMALPDPSKRPLLAKKVAQRLYQSRLHGQETIVGCMAILGEVNC